MDNILDNLVFLDACGYNIFNPNNIIDGNLEPGYSNGSTTDQFLNRTFINDLYPDTVYVTATPQVRRHGTNQKVYECIQVWDDNWSDQYRCVHPKDMLERLYEAYENCRNKRLIVHFIKPHHRFVGETGEGLAHRTTTGDGVISGDDNLSIWERLRRGEVDEKLVWNAYEENKQIVLSYIKELIDNMLGKTVVISDHGDVFGRYNLYGHPCGKFINELVKVPWLEIESSERKTIVEQKRSHSDPSVSDLMLNRICAFGI